VATRPAPGGGRVDPRRIVPAIGGRAGSGPPRQNKQPRGAAGALGRSPAGGTVPPPLPQAPRHRAAARTACRLCRAAAPPPRPVDEHARCTGCTTIV